MDFEVCIDSVEGAIMASKYGAKRVELCSALDLGGLTPSVGMIEACVEASESAVYVMIRPSAGGFAYTDAEIRLMEEDIRMVAAAGANGVVFGMLDEKGNPDIQKCMYLMESVRTLELGATFHRAIDLCKNPLKAVEDCFNIGFERILTSGGKEKAIDGIDLIAEMAKVAQNRIEIIAGSGINHQNVHKFLDLGVHAVHFTARRLVNEGLQLEMGRKYELDEEKIRTISELLSNDEN